MTLIEEFKQVAIKYKVELCKMFELDESYGWWIGDDIGGVYCNGDLFCLTFQEMRFIVDHNISKDEFLAYNEYVDFCMEFNQVAPNLDAWFRGCPRHSAEDIKHLRVLKREFEIACNALTQAKNKL